MGQVSTELLRWRIAVTDEVRGMRRYGTKGRRVRERAAQVTDEVRRTKKYGMGWTSTGEVETDEVRETKEIGTMRAPLGEVETYEVRWTMGDMGAG